MSRPTKSKVAFSTALTVLPPLNPDAPIETADRALPIYSVIPALCIGYVVTDNRTEPHIRFGEIAVIDTQDREPLAGELFLIRYNHPLHASGILKLVQIIRKTTPPFGDEKSPFWAAPYAPQSDVPGYGKLRMIDGPYDAKYLREKLVGRVIGIMEVFRDSLREGGDPDMFFGR